MSQTLAKIIERAHSEFGIIGRDREISVIHLALSASRHLLIEGPVGVGKTVLAQAIASLHGRSMVRVDGDSRFTEQKLTGVFDPARVMREGYVADAFLEGPLVRAMRAGSILFVNELNRMPESVQNVLLPVLDEGLLLVPHLGEVRAAPGFLVIATQNPREFVATSHLSEALIDRMEWVSLSHQSAEEETQIVRRLVQVDEPWLSLAVEAARLTRSHSKVKRGASVRAAIAMAKLMAARAAETKTLTDEDFVVCAKLALATRIELLAGVTSGEQFEHALEVLVRDLLAQLKKKLLNSEGGAGIHVLEDARGPLEHADVKIHAEGSSFHFFAEPMGSVEVYDGTGYDQKQAWDVAVRFQDIRRYAHVTDMQKRKLKARAVSGVIERARRLVGRVGAPEVPVVLGLLDFLDGGSRGEIDVDSTLSEGELRFESRHERRRPLAVVMDVSMSMKGDKLAHLALSVAAIALSVPAEAMGDVVLLGFDSRLRWVKRFDEKVSVEELVERVLDLPAGGFTNMELALRAIADELSSEGRVRASVVLIGDGKYTEGADPLPLASSFHRLSVLKIGRDIGGRDLLKQMAEQGGGAFFEGRTYADLPKVLYEAIRYANRG